MNTTQIAEAISRQIKKIENSILNQTNEITITNYKSPNDPEYILKLENAMKKNFDYIIKKDSMTSSSIKQSIVSVNTTTPQWQNIYNPKLLSNIPPPPVPPKQLHRLGIGTSITATSTHTSTDVTTVSTTEQVQNNSNSNISSGSQSIYISNLPTDITQEELEILFGAHSKIKKIKIYMSTQVIAGSSSSKPKGDALITYYKPEDAITACLKFNLLDIGEGHVLNVVRADFSSSHTKNSSSNNNSNKKDALIIQHSSSIVADHPFVHNNDIIDDNNILSKLFAEILPNEMEVYCYPIVVICNVFDQHDQRIQCDPNFLSEIETDMLVECCMHGNVRIMQLLTIDQATFSRIRNQVESNISLDGAIAVTYEDLECAIKCAKALDERWFDSKQLYIELIYPCDNPYTNTCNNNSNNDNNYNNNKLSSISIPPPQPPKIPKPIHLNLTSEPTQLLVQSKEQQQQQIVSQSQVTLITHLSKNLKGIIEQKSIDSSNNNTSNNTSCSNNNVIINTNVEEVEDVEDFLNSLL